MGGGGDAPPDGGGDGIRVAVRVRPFLPHEAGTTSCVEVTPQTNQISIGRSLSDPEQYAGDHEADKKTFTFDCALPGTSPQSAIYDACVSSLITSCLEGHNATTLAYGQTGAGKTYTILGPGSASAAGASESVRKEVGIIPRALGEIFERLEGRRIAEEATYEYNVQFQFLELYGEEIRDLLAASFQASHEGPRTPRAGSGAATGSAAARSKPKAAKLMIRDTGDDAEVLGATSTPVKSAEEALLCLTRGMLKRVVGATAMNAESSRSHAMMTVLIEQRIKDETGGTEIRKSKYNFVDLAGSERSKRTGAKGKRLKEGIDINKGLLVLGNVISALSSPDPKKRKFVPFRDSKLTRLLRGSLGGNHKTLLIACVSPSARNLEESLNCLRYANRAKNIKNKTGGGGGGRKVGGDPVLAKLLADLRAQVGGLAGELLRVRTSGEDPAAVAAESKFETKELEKLYDDFGDKSDGGGKKSPASAPAEKKDDGGGGDNADASESRAAPQSQEDGSGADSETKAELDRVSKELAERSEALKSAEAELEKLRAAVGGTAASKGAEGAEEGEAATTETATHEKKEEEEDAEGEEKKDEAATVPEAPKAAAAVEESALDAIVKRIISFQAEAEAADGEKRRRRRVRRSPNSFGDDESRSSYGYDDDDTAADDYSVAGTVMTEVTGTYLGEEDLAAEEEEERRELRRRRQSIVAEDPRDEVASALYRTGLFLVEHEDYESSLPCFEVSLGIRRERFGWEDPTVGDVLYMEGLVRACTRDHDRALLLLYDALRIRRMHADSPNAAATLRTIGDLHVSKGEYDLADAFYEESLQEASACGDDSIPDVLLSLAKVKKRLGMKREALDCFEEVLRVWQDRFGPDDPRSVTVTASLSYEIGILSFQLSEYTHGEQRLRNFVWVRKQQGAGPDSPDPRVARACYTLGNYAAHELRDADRARNYWAEALAMYESGLPEDHPHIAALRDSIGRATELSSPRQGRGLFSRFRKDDHHADDEAPIVVPDVQFQCMQGMRRSSVQ